MDGMEIIETAFGSGIRITKPIIRDREFIFIKKVMKGQDIR